MNSDKNHWCESWFDSNYYQLLYKDRNVKEAEQFAANLLHYLAPKPNSKMHDVACGRGRYSIFLNRKGFDVRGTDASQSAIEFAKKFTREDLEFEVHDMRTCLEESNFDFVFSFFTSFGYFDTDEENFKVLDAISRSLKPNGMFVLDFINSDWIKANYVKEEQKVLGEIEFKISRKVEGKFLLKEISISDKGKKICFVEKVCMYDQNDFEEFFSRSNFKLVNLFGDYSLNTFSAKNSERLIMVAAKTN